MATTTTNRIAGSNGSGIPFCDNAERDLLACLLIDDSQVPVAEKIVAVDDFVAEDNRIIYGHIIAADALGHLVDVRLLLRQLDESGDLERVGGTAYLAELAQLGTRAKNAAYFAEKIREKARRRRAMIAYERAQEKIRDGDDLAEVQSRLHDELQGNGTSAASIISVGELIEGPTRMRQPVVDGLLRRGETGNIIAASKVGKSWLAYSLALSVVTGSRWLKTFQCFAGRVLVVDNELHAEVLASRIPTVADALGIQADEYRDKLDVVTLRGLSVDLYGVARLLNRVRPDTYDLVIADAFYRFIPEGTSENDNAQVMALYNTIDSIARRMGSAWVNIHHASKGSQGAKSVTDVGSGAGSQSRAADTHIVLRPHEEDGIVVLEAAVRSFPPIEPLALRWTFPVWQPEYGVDTSKLQGNLTKQQQKQQNSDKEGFTKIMDAIAADGPATQSALVRRTGISRARIQRLLAMLEAEKNLAVKDIQVGGNDACEYHLSE